MKYKSMLNKNSAMKQLLMSIVVISPFVALYIISKTVFNEMYLFEWTARHLYIYLWVLVLILIYLKKYKLATFISIGNFIGIFAGQFIGDYMRNKNIRSITEVLNYEEIYRLHHHPGVEIWLGTILLIVIFMSLIQVFKRTFQRKNNWKI